MKLCSMNWTIAAGLTLALAGCGGGGNGGIRVPTPIPTITPTPTTSAPLVSTITTDKTSYKRGETVNVTVTFRNNSSVEQTLTSGSSSFFLVRIARESGGETTISNPGTHVITTIRLAPGATRQESGVWNQMGTFGTAQVFGQAPQGRYILRSDVRLQTSAPLDNIPTTITLTD